jgi:hypothetical protein
MAEYSIEIVSRPAVEILLAITAPLLGPVYWSTIVGKPETFPPSIHSHLISDITGLQAALNSKAASIHTHIIGDITGLQAVLDTRGIPAGGTAGQVLAKVNGTDYQVIWATPASGGGSGSIAWADITGKPSTFAPSAHTHVISEVTSLQSALDGKQASGSYAAAVHTHAIADVTSLQTALDGKQAAGAYAVSVHGHLIADVNNLQTALDGKAASVHTHAIADVTGLQTLLDDANGQSIVNALIFG